MSVLQPSGDVDLGPLPFLPDASFLHLAGRVCSRNKIEISSGPRELLSRTIKAGNIDHVVLLGTTKLIIRVPTNGWGNHWTENAVCLMKSQVATLSFVCKNTVIPVPRVLDHDTSKMNDIFAPYMCLSFIEGKGLVESWFDRSTSGSVDTEQRRVNILKALAMSYLQLSRYTFEKMGSLFESDDGTFVARECYERLRGGHAVQVSGPFRHGEDYLESRHHPFKRSYDRFTLGMARIMRVARACLPLEDCEGRFVLPLPSTDPRNILMDDMGRLNGITDWGAVTTMPPCVGSVRFPPVVTRDWDPLSYMWPADSGRENSPEELARYRAEYRKQLERYSNYENLKYLPKAHIWEAVWSACLDERRRAGVCQRLVREGFGQGAAGERALLDITAGKMTELRWKDLEKRLKRTMAVARFAQTVQRYSVPAVNSQD